MDPNRDIPGVIRRRRYPKRDTDRRYLRQNYVAMDTETTLADVLAWANENVSVPFDRITINFSTFSWTDDATDEEKDAWDREEEVRAARTEKWEREQLARLTEKYGADG